MITIFDTLPPARAAAFVRANGLLGFEARPFAGGRWGVVEHRQDSAGRIEQAWPCGGGRLEACQTARRWAEATGTEVLGEGQARLGLEALAAGLRALCGKGVAA